MHRDVLWPFLLRSPNEFREPRFCVLQRPATGRLAAQRGLALCGSWHQTSSKFWSVRLEYSRKSFLREALARYDGDRIHCLRPPPFLQKMCSDWRKRREQRTGISAHTLPSRAATICQARTSNRLRPRHAGGVPTKPPLSDFDRLRLEYETQRQENRGIASLSPLVPESNKIFTDEPQHQLNAEVNVGSIVALMGNG